MLFEKDELRKEWRGEAVTSIVVIAMSIFGLILSISWIRNPGKGLTEEKELVEYSGKIIEIKEPGLSYESDVCWIIKMEDERNILIKDEQMDFIGDDKFASMQPGKTLIYKIDDLSQEKVDVEAKELIYEDEIIYSYDDYSTTFLKARKTGWILAPILTFSILYFGMYLIKCIKMLKELENYI